MMNGKKPVIGITMGDPAGIGPEITLKALLKPEIFEFCKPIVIGDLKILERTAKKFRSRRINTPNPFYK